MGSLRDSPEQFAAWLDANGYSEQVKAQKLKEFSQRRKRLLVEGAVQDEQRAQAGGFLRGAAGAAGSAAMNFANTATLGYLPKIAGAVAGSESRERMEVGLEASRQVNPGAAAAGSLGAFFTPGSAARMATQAGARGVTALTGTRLLTQRTVESALAARAGSQIAQNFAGAAGGIGAMRLLESRDEDNSLSARLSTAAEDIRSPVTLGTSVAFGAATARLTGPRSTKSLQDLFDKYRKETGREIPPDIATDNAELQKFMDAAARVPGLANSVERVRTELIGGLRAMLNQVAKRSGVPMSKPSRTAAHGARHLVGGRDAGAVTRARRGPQEAALTREGRNTLTSLQQQNLIAALRKSISGKPLSDERGAEMTKFVRDFIRVAGKKRLDVEELEGFRKRAGSLGYGWGRGPMDSRVAERGRVEARRFYTALDEAIESAGPQYARALHAGERLRRMEESLSSVKVSDVDDVILHSFWGTKGNPLKRWEALQEYGSPTDIAAMKGWYFWRLVEGASAKNGTLLPNKLERMFSGAGMFNRQVVDKVLPGVRRELMDHAQIAELARKGILAAEGSQTAGRGARLALGTGAAGTVAALLANPFATIGPVLGVGATAWVIRRASSSLVEGATGQAVSRLAQGVPPRGLASLPAALQSRGGIEGLGRDAVGALRDLTQLGGSGVQSAIRTRQQGETQ